MVGFWHWHISTSIITDISPPWWDFVMVGICRQAIPIIIITNMGSGGFHCAQTLDWTGSFASFFSPLHSPVSSLHSVLLFWSFGNTMGCSLILNSIIWIPFQQQSFPHFSSFTIQCSASSSAAASMFIISIIGWPNSLRFLQFNLGNNPFLLSSSFDCSKASRISWISRRSVTSGILLRVILDL